MEVRCLCRLLTLPKARQERETGGVTKTDDEPFVTPPLRILHDMSQQRGAHSARHSDGPSATAAAAAERPTDGSVLTTRTIGGARTSVAAQIAVGRRRRTREGVLTSQADYEARHVELMRYLRQVGGAHPGGAEPPLTTAANRWSGELGDGGAFPGGRPGAPPQPRLPIGIDATSGLRGLGGGVRLGDAGPQRTALQSAWEQERLQRGAQRRWVPYVVVALFFALVGLRRWFAAMPSPLTTTGSGAKDAAATGDAHRTEEGAVASAMAPTAAAGDACDAGRDEAAAGCRRPV